MHPAAGCLQPLNRTSGRPGTSALNAKRPPASGCFLSSWSDRPIQQAAFFAHRKGADIFRSRPSSILPGGRVKSVDHPALNINPVEVLLGGIPEWSFTEQRLCIENARDIRHYSLLPKR